MKNGKRKRVSKKDQKKIRETVRKREDSQDRQYHQDVASGVNKK